MKLPDFEAWAIFACVVEHRSFTAAAIALGTSKATVSKAVARLEAHLGTALFHRSSRQLVLTDAGTKLAPRAAALLAEAQGAEEEAREEARAPSGPVRMAAPMAFGLKYLGPMLADFMADHPGISIDVQLSDAKVDIIAGGFDLALRVATLPDSALRARRVGNVRGHLVGAPAYFDRHGRPRHPSDLAHHRVFEYTNITAAMSFTGPGGEVASVRPEGPLRSNSGELFLPALHAGLGIARLPDFIVAEDLATGRLEEVLTDWAGPPIGLHLLTPPAGPRPRRVTLLIDHLADRLKRACE
jgi:DNA-binding transcriptional LysR family regulator